MSSDSLVNPIEACIEAANLNRCGGRRSGADRIREDGVFQVQRLASDLAFATRGNVHPLASPLRMSFDSGSVEPDR